jgi:pimeloyl-ACP methyl ester carboxylesterase
VQRIPYGRNSRGPAKGVILFQHGLSDTSAGVCLNNPSEGLPYVFADAGYEVWLGNNRGNGYSMTNNKYNPDDAEFWDFSWDEMATYDLPATINYVLKTSKFQKLTFIGHSEGTIQAFSGFLNPNFNVTSKVNLYVALAPVAYVGHLGTILFRALADVDSDTLLEILGVKEFYLPTAIQNFLPNICNLFPSFCEFSLELIMGPSTNLNKTRLGYYLGYEPNPTSVKNMAHWAQGVRSQSFQKYDYGSQGNIKHYNQPIPPQYELEYFPKNLPVALFTGSNDYLADPLDVQTLLSQLPITPYYHNEPTFSHIDFILAPDAATLIYPRILTLIQNVMQGKPII